MPQRARQRPRATLWPRRPEVDSLTNIKKCHWSMLILTISSNLEGPKVPNCWNSICFIAYLKHVKSEVSAWPRRPQFDSLTNIKKCHWSLLISTIWLNMESPNVPNCRFFHLFYCIFETHEISSFGLAEAAPIWFAYKHQEMSLVLANINNFTKYGRSKGPKVLKFHVCYCIFESIMFHENGLPRRTPKIAIYSFQKYSYFVRPSASSSNMEVLWQHICINNHCFYCVFETHEIWSFGFTLMMICCANSVVPKLQ